VAPTGSPDVPEGDLLFGDEFNDPASGWAEGEIGTSSVAYGPDVLHFAIASANNSIWTPRQLGDDYGVVLVGGLFQANAGGGFGLLCSGDDGTYYGALVTTEGNLVFFSIEGSETTVLQRHEDLDLEVPVGTQVSFGLECGATSSGALRLVPFLFETGPLAIFQQVDEGPEAFTGVVLYGESFDDNYAMDVHAVAAYGLSGSTEGITPEGEELLGHVPDELSDTCYEVPVTDDATASIHCVLQTEGTGAELASYVQYPTNVSMDATFDENVERFPADEPTGDCQTGPNEDTWNIEGEVFGRLLCAPQEHGIRFDWTDDRLGIFSTLIDFDGDYENTYNLWVDAGPIP